MKIDDLAARKKLSAIMLTMLLSACATGGPTIATGPAAMAKIAYEVGPCFGFCPVYTASINSAGEVSFDGIRHTATIGQKSLRADEKLFRSFAEALAPYRPTAGTTASTDCETRISDQQHYRISWTAPDGTITVLEHDKGCRSARNDVLNGLLQDAPERLGIAEWARQLTRPGASRG